MLRKAFLLFILLRLFIHPISLFVDLFCCGLPGKNRFLCIFLGTLFFMLILSSSFLSFSPLAFYRYRFISSLSFSHTLPTYLALLFASCSNWIDWENPPPKATGFFFPSRSGSMKDQNSRERQLKMGPIYSLI